VAWRATWPSRCCGGSSSDPRRDLRATRSDFTGLAFADAEIALDPDGPDGLSGLPEEGCASRPARRIGNESELAIDCALRQRRRGRRSSESMRLPSTPGMYSISSTIVPSGSRQQTTASMPVAASGPRGGVMNATPRARRFW